jgi:hypothetical protein
MAEPEEAHPMAVTARLLRQPSRRFTDTPFKQVAKLSLLCRQLVRREVRRFLMTREADLFAARVGTFEAKADVLGAGD